MVVKGGKKNERIGISRAVGEEKADGKRRKRRKKMEVKLVTRWGRGDGSKRRKEKQERDGISRAVREQKEDKKGRKRRKKMRCEGVAVWGSVIVGRRIMRGSR